MKLQLHLLTAGLLLAWGAAQAQSSVQLYGQMTAGLGYRNHLTGNTSLKDANNSLLAASLLGVRGTEDLGGGMSAVFRLEHGINSDTGTATNAKFWNRQAFVGLNISPMATITLGRQFHAATDRAIQSLDVYNLGGTNLSTTPQALFGVNKFAANDSRADDSVKLRLRGPMGLTAGVSAAFDDGAGRSHSVDVAQVTPGYAVGAYMVTFKSPVLTANNTRPEHQTWGLGGNALVGPVRLYAHYMTSDTDPSAVGRVKQTNKILHLGANWAVTQQAFIKAALYSDKGTALNGVNGRNGKKTTYVLSGEYFLSKRTSLYAATHSNKFADGYKLEATNIAALARDANASSTQGLSTGIRHDF